MIPIFTRRALGVHLRRHRRSIAAQFADAIEGTAMPACNHNVRASCPKCQARQTSLADAKLIRETGGVL